MSGDRGRTGRSCKQVQKTGLSIIDISPKQKECRRPPPPPPVTKSQCKNNIIRNEIQDWSLGPGKKGGKKVNMNHLLNCTFKAREAVLSERRPTGNSLYKKMPPINHVRTHCQTLLRNVKGCPGPEEMALDIDMHVDWDECIAGLKFYQEKDSKNSCVICLSDMPLCPRSTRCGHVFCFPCILHHFSVQTDQDYPAQSSSWHKCPICHKEILKRKLKPSRIVSTEPKIKVGDVITFDLITREKGSIFSQPFGNSTCLELTGRNVDLLSSPFAWVSHLEEMELLQEDLMTLQVGLVDAEDSEIRYFEEAMEIVKNELIKLRTTQEPSTLSIQTINPDADKGLVHFYQSGTRRSFLHPISNRCLLMKYGEKLPATVSGRVVEVDTLILYPDEQAKFKFLSHLPSGTTVQLIELEMNSMKVQEEKIVFEKAEYQAMHKALQKRKQQRNARKREEARYEKSFHVQENHYIFDEMDFPMSSSTNSGFEPVFQNFDDLSLQNHATEPSGSFGLAAKLASPVTRTSFGLAAKLQQQSSSSVSQIEPASIESPGPCFVIKQKSNKRRGKNKRDKKSF